MAKRKDKPQFCTAPDRHAPKLRCGYPLPCPWHTAAGKRIIRVGVLVDRRRGDRRRSVESKPEILD